MVRLRASVTYEKTLSQIKYNTKINLSKLTNNYNIQQYFSTMIKYMQDDHEIVV